LSERAAVIIFVTTEKTVLYGKVAV